MDWFASRFIKASLVWLGLGVSLGVAMASHPVWVVYRPAHLHMTLLGFVTMMIYGVGYHVLPRFFGRPLLHKWLGGVHWWLSNAGLALMVAGFMIAPHSPERSVLVVASGGSLSALGAFAFIFIIWTTMDGPERAQRIVSAPAPRRPPVIQPDD